MCFVCCGELLSSAPVSEGEQPAGPMEFGAGPGRSGSLPGLDHGAEIAPEDGGPGSAGVSFKWFGTNGWEIKFGNKTILFDPWFGRYDAGFLTGVFDPKTPLTVPEDLIDKHIKEADQILIGHGHWDHFADIPSIAKKTGAMVIGSETHTNLLRAYEIPEEQAVLVKGGECMQFDGYTIEVFRSLHSFGPKKKFVVPGHLFSVPEVPATVRDLPEGDSFIYQITIDEKFRILLMSTANFIEREIVGSEPDVALVASLGSDQIYQYTPRLLAALNYPKVILPTHWDNFSKPFSEEPQDLRDLFGDAGNMDLWVEQAKQVSPQSQIVVMDFFKSFAP